ncbi:ABC transporter permease [Saccharopolyspora sp. NPDC000359]|uniref:ABC transporter permease subunit n=1 Tax=Saccharopolyspora sp. NPDC000359 TaxID=3154251 RepID=UPI00332EBBC8
MTWVAWRQHRLGVAVFTVAFLAVAGVYLFADALGTTAHAVFGTPDGFTGTFWLAERLDVVRLLSLLVGVFVGAPLVAREVEQRTYRYAWTQGVSRRRWLSTKVLLLGAVVLLLSTAYTAVHMWWFAPVAGQQGWFTIYNQAGVVFPAYCLFSFVLGVAAGAVVRQTVVAMVITLVGGVVAMFGMSLLRLRFAEPVTLFGPADSTAIDDVARLGDVLGSGGSPTATFVTFHPAERFWPFQFTEASIVLGMTLAALAVAFWRLRRKTS